VGDAFPDGYFNTRVFGQDVFIDVEHQPQNGAAGTIVELALDGARLRGLVDWTPYGVDEVRNKARRYMSIEFHAN
jgi:hypothetical protein